ncbi:hypothetical protein MGAD_00820 [Mycolicibacterium gadium]|uniref:Transposase n=1 Tax=Mycolicibacterium gadium TaxID=1794 RepID=A0A7I7WFY1_MYCGU|nr:hypothetical protein MGAD_00820 [Mycolicibacterium gadium]
MQARLLDEHSPKQIAKRLVLDFPDDVEMRVSHETIYTSIYVQGKGSLRRELHTCLRTGRALRKPQRRPMNAVVASATWSTSVSVHPRLKTARCPGIGRAI